MGAISTLLPELAATTSLTYCCTFGHYKQTDWTDVRPLPWEDLAALLTRHLVGPKEGTCIVPATFTGTRRHEKDAQQIAVVLLDSDAGYNLDDIRDAVAAQGWAAAIASTHSHRTTRTRARRGNWDKFRVTVSDPALAPAAFLRGKGYLERMAEGARIAEETEEFVVFAHQPCPKFRIALPLMRPWRASRYDNQRSANAAWKERVAALAAILHLQHDQACTDTSRLFFLPRRPADGPPAETAVLRGRPCDIFALPAAEGHKGAGGQRGRSGGARRRRSPEKIEFTDPDTGEVLDLQAWARHHAPRFELATALQARRPEVFVPRPDEGAKRHIRCVNEGEHTQAGADAACFVVNASQGTHNSFAYHCRHAHCDGQDRLRFLRQMLEERWLTPADLTDPAFLVEGRPARPVIRFLPGQVAEIVDQAEQALIDAELGLYQRGTFIVRPGTVRVSVTLARDLTAQRMIEVGDRALVEEMTKAAAWEKYDKRSDAWVAMDAPLAIAATYLQRRGKWRLPVLAGLINAPTLRPDGTILSQPGYDPATGLLLGTEDASFPAVPEEPDWEEGRAALSVLMGLIETFPFVSDADRAVAISAILTSTIRRSLPTAPLHAFTAPAAGSGKSMLVDLASVITTGREAGVIAQGKTEEELEKRLGALLLAGDQVIAIDNCEAPLGGEFLCQMLTQPVVRARVLGRSEAPELPAGAMVTATGNNLVLVGDMTRRALLCSLDPQEERPELRRFGSNPVSLAKADQEHYLAAALTALRAFHIAGRPRQADPLGSFEVWSDWVRGTLLWFGQQDPLSTMAGARELDPKLDALTAVVLQWAEVIGDRSVSVRDIIERATAPRTVAGQGFITTPRQEFAHPDFREALLTVTGDGGAVNSRRLGKWVAANQNRIVKGWRIARERKNTGNLRWRLEKVKEAGQRTAA